MAEAIPGRYADGRTARLHPVRVRLVAAGLTIADAAGKWIALWPYEKLEPAETVREGQPVRLRLGDDAGARLTLEGTASLDSLWRAAPQLRRSRRMGRRAWRRVATLVALAGGIGVGAVYGLPRLADALTGLVPVSWEEAVGRAVQREIIGFFVEDDEEPICTAAAGRAALDRMTQRLAAEIETDFTFTVTVANGKAVNAFAVPGGYIVILRGLIEFAGSADEVAAILAHEMAHVVRRDTTRAMIRNAGYGVLIDALLGGSVGSGWAGSVGEALIVTAYSREAEAEADAAAMDFLEAAGLSSDGGVLFFERLKRHYGDAPRALAMVSTHPMTEDRIAALRRRSSDGDDAMTDAEWQALLAVCGETAGIE